MANSVVVGYEGTGAAKRVFFITADLNFPQDLIGQIKAGENPPGIQNIRKREWVKILFFLDFNLCANALPLVAPAYRSGQGYATHLAAFVLIPPLFLSLTFVQEICYYFKQVIDRSNENTVSYKEKGVL